MMDEIIPGSAFADRKRIQDDIRMQYGEWIPQRDFAWVDGEWTLDGMEPYEWAEAMLGEGD